VVIKYSWMQYKRMMMTNKLAFIHMIVVIPGMGFAIYYMKGGLVSPRHSWLSHLIFLIFLLQTLMIVTKRFKNEFFFSLRCCSIFPQKRTTISLYTLIFGVIDFNVFIYVVVSAGMILCVTNWGLIVNISFLLIFVLCEIVYLIFMMLTIEIMTEKYGNSKNLFIVTFFPFLFIEQYTRFAEKFYLFDFYPISGWIGSTALSALKGDMIQVLLYFCITISMAFIGWFLFKSIFFPRKNNVF